MITAKFVINSQTLHNVYGGAEERAKRKSSLYTLISDKGIMSEAKEYAKKELDGILKAEAFTMERQTLHYAFRVASMILWLLGGILAITIITMIALFALNMLDVTKAEGIFLVSTATTFGTFFMGLVVAVYARLGIDIAKGKGEVPKTLP